MLFLLAFLLLYLVLWLVFLGALPLLERLLAKGAHRAAAFRYRDYLPVFLIAAAGIGAAMFTGDAFLDIAERVQADSWQVREIDGLAHTWAASHRTSGSTLFFDTMTQIGNPAVLVGIILLISAGLVMKHHWRWAVYLVATAAIGALLNLQLKTYFERARPELAEALRSAHGYSFPSGHAMGSAVVFGALAYLSFRSVRGWLARSAALAACFSIIVAIALSRVYLGVHWISDVGAGVACGLLWVVSATVAYETFRRIRLVRALRKKAAQPPAEN